MLRETPGLLFMGTMFFRWSGQWQAREDADWIPVSLVCRCFTVCIWWWAHGWLLSISQGSRQASSSWALCIFAGAGRGGRGQMLTHCAWEWCTSAPSCCRPRCGLPLWCIDGEHPALC